MPINRRFVGQYVMCIRQYILMKSNSQNIKQNPEQEKNKQGQQEIVMPYPKQSQAYLNILGKPNLNKNLIFKDLQTRRRLERLYLSTFQSKQKMYESIQQQRFSDRKSNFNDLFKHESKPNIFTIKFNEQHILPKKYTKNNFSSKLVRKKNIQYGSKSVLNSPASKNKQQSSSPEGQLFKQNQFTPRLTRLDYTKPKKQILTNYFSKFYSLSTSRDKKDNDINYLPNLCEVSHLEQLQKYKDYLLQYQNQTKYNIMPKVNVNFKSKKNFEKEQKPRILKKKHNAKRLNQKFSPWSQQKYEGISTID